MPHRTRDWARTNDGSPPHLHEQSARIHAKRQRHSSSDDQQKQPAADTAARSRIRSDQQQKRPAADTATRSGGDAFSIITWNIDGLRAFLADAARLAALVGLLSETPIVLCLLEHKLQLGGASSLEARAQLEAIADRHGYDASWTFSPRKGRDGLVALVHRSAHLAAPPREPSLRLASCTRERRLLHVELEELHVLLVYAPNSGQPGRLAFRLEEWEPSVRLLLCGLRGERPDGVAKALVLQGDLNVAHVRALDAWGTTHADFGGGKASGRTPEEAEALDILLRECGLVTPSPAHTTP